VKRDSPDQVKENEMGRACSTNVGEQECIQDIGGETTPLGIPGHRDRIILK
jgi:hypothetical protein